MQFLRLKTRDGAIISLLVIKKSKIIVKEVLKISYRGWKPPINLYIVSKHQKREKIQNGLNGSKMTS